MNCFTTPQQLGEYSGCCLFQQNTLHIHKNNIKTGQHSTLGNKSKNTIKRSNTQNKEKANMEEKTQNRNNQKNKVSLSKMNSKNSSIQKSKLHPTKDQTLQNISNPTQSVHHTNHLHKSHINAQIQNSPTVIVQKSQYFHVQNKNNSLKKERATHENKNKTKGQYANKYKIVRNQQNIQHSLNAFKNENINNHNYTTPTATKAVNELHPNPKNINIFFGNSPYTFSHSNQPDYISTNKSHHLTNTNVRNQNKFHSELKQSHERKMESFSKRSVSLCKNPLGMGENEGRYLGIQGMNRKLVKSVVTESQGESKKVEQSIIVMDFFNPCEQQRRKFEESLKRKTQYYNS